MQIEKNRKNRWQIEFNSETLTLEQWAVGTHLHRPTAGLPHAGQIRAARFVGARHRMLRRSPPGRRGARARAPKRGTIHGELDGGALTHRRARAPASKPRWRRHAHSAGPPRPAAVTSVSWREKTERENEPRVCGRRGVAEFCSREKSARPSDLDRRRRTAGNGGRRTGQFGPKRGAAPGRFGGLAIGCWAEGPSVARAERAGPISCLGCFNSESFKLFFYFPKEFLIVVFE